MKQIFNLSKILLEYRSYRQPNATFLNFTHNSINQMTPSKKTNNSSKPSTHITKNTKLKTYLATIPHSKLNFTSIKTKNKLINQINNKLQSKSNNLSYILRILHQKFPKILVLTPKLFTLIVSKTILLIHLKKLDRKLPKIRHIKNNRKSSLPAF